MKVNLIKRLRRLKRQLKIIAMVLACSLFMYKHIITTRSRKLVAHLDSRSLIKNQLFQSDIMEKSTMKETLFYFNESLNIENITPEDDQERAYQGKVSNENELTQTNSVNCTLWEPYRDDLIATLPSRIQLNPSRFLYPGFYGGPNNQIMGLLQSIYVAIRLNRTLVVPRFSTHQYTFGKVEIVPAFQRINIGRLCSFVSCISIEQFRKTCRGKMDVIFKAKEVTIQNVEKYERDTEMNILQKPDNDGADKLKLSQTAQSALLTYPDSSYVISRDHWLPSNEDDIRAVYNTTASCALHALSYRSVEIMEKGKIAFPLLPSASNIHKIPDDVLYSAVTDSVHLPPCVTAAAENYVNAIIGNREYVALHWRYNEEDWFKPCQRPERKPVCEALKKITPQDVAHAIVNNLPPLQNNAKLRGRLPVYIAAPPSLKDFKLEIFSHMERINPSLEAVSVELEQYFKKTGLVQCWQKADWVSHDDVISLTEMEIVRMSRYFFYSIRSSWSANIRPLRWEWKDGNTDKLFEASIFDLITHAKSGLTSLV
ncbi:uncharacterized protein LOC143463324 isoform X1 [Clavelina lepadiformis]|uniref:uncharacterized protein LOC143463324 isoform X1 n=1 Tax=Clavelina lepadiformis TaxID=159417 RepID=UPI0040439413